MEVSSCEVAEDPYMFITRISLLALVYLQFDYQSFKWLMKHRRVIKLPKIFLHDICNGFSRDVLF